MDRVVYRSGEMLVQELRETRLPASTVALWNLGQAGYVVKGADKGECIVFDPYLTSSIETNQPDTEFRREFPPPLQPTDLAGVAAVLVTHHHDDHLDIETLSTLSAASPDTKVVLPAPHVHVIQHLVQPTQIIKAQADAAFTVGSFHVQPVAAAHPTYETDDTGDSLYLGYRVTVGGIRLFHAGDTVVTPELVEAIAAFQPHIALLPINGGDYERTRRGIVGNMGFREAADLVAAVHADIVVPVHYDLFPNNRDNPAYFVDYLFSQHRDQKFHMMAVGERFVYMA